MLIGFLVFPLAFLANFIFSILAALSASKGKAYRYPFALRLVSYIPAQRGRAPFMKVLMTVPSPSSNRPISIV